MRKHPHPTTIKIILRAREIITDPTHWTQGSHALDADGIQRHPWHSKAIRFTADAALWRAAHELFGEDYDSANRAGTIALHAVDTRQGSIVRYLNLSSTNNELGHQAVLQLFDEALAEPPKATRN